MPTTRLTVLAAATLLFTAAGCNNGSDTGGKPAADASRQITATAQSQDQPADDKISGKQNKLEDMARVEREIRAHAEKKAAAGKKRDEDRASIARDKLSKQVGPAMDTPP